MPFPHFLVIVQTPGASPSSRFRPVDKGKVRLYPQVLQRLSGLEGAFRFSLMSRPFDPVL